MNKEAQHGPQKERTVRRPTCIYIITAAIPEGQRKVWLKHENKMNYESRLFKDLFHDGSTGLNPGNGYS